ncbi:MAG: Ig-like domain-containing protein, partial [Steroidobacteraceae bacterium]
PGTFTLSAAGSDSDGSIKEVNFLANGNLVGTDTAAPYSIDWTLVPAGSYAITARATDNEGASTTSSSVAVSVVSGAPAAPSRLSASALTGRQIKLSWTDNSSNETGFEIQQATSNTFGSGLSTTTVAAYVKTYTASGLVLGATYYYRVRAVNGGLSSAWSTTAKATVKR